MEETTVVVVSYSGKEINAKLVYYGAGLSGKTTNLESIYEAVPESSRGKMVSMKTQSDRTLFFDLLPLDLGEIMGFKTRFLLYTVPGQVFYNATRKLVLKGADAIVFVADSEVGKMDENKESLANLRANLIEYELNLDEIPWVIQYNKRDLANVYSLEELNRELNPQGKVAAFEAVATQGKGVFETFRGISHLLMEKVTKELRRAPLSGARATRSDDSLSRPVVQQPGQEAAPTKRDAKPAVEPAATARPGPAAPVRPGPAAPIRPEPAAPRLQTPPARTEKSPIDGVKEPVARQETIRPEPQISGAPPSTAVPANVTPTSATPANPPSMLGYYGRELSLNEPAQSPPVESRAAKPTAPESKTSRPATPVEEDRFQSRLSPSGFEPRPSMLASSSASLDLAAETASTSPARPSVAPAKDPAATRESPTPSAAAPSTEVVVPISIPKGATREIVLKIVITDGE